MPWSFASSRRASFSSALAWTSRPRTATCSRVRARRRTSSTTARRPRSRHAVRARRLHADGPRRARRRADHLRSDRRRHQRRSLSAAGGSRRRTGRRGGRGLARRGRPAARRHAHGRCARRAEVRPDEIQQPHAHERGVRAERQRTAPCASRRARSCTAAAWPDNIALRRRRRLCPNDVRAAVGRREHSGARAGPARVARHHGHRRRAPESRDAGQQLGRDAPRPRRRRGVHGHERVARGIRFLVRAASARVRESTARRCRSAATRRGAPRSRRCPRPASCRTPCSRTTT